MKYRLMIAFSISIMIIVVISIYFADNTNPVCIVESNFDESIYANTLPIEVAQCVECDVCGKELERNGDIYLKKGNINGAINSYNKALIAYEDYLKYEPNSKCLINGIKRINEKLRRLQ